MRCRARRRAPRLPAAGERLGRLGWRGPGQPADPPLTTPLGPPVAAAGPARLLRRGPRCAGCALRALRSGSPAEHATLAPSPTDLPRGAASRSAADGR